MPIEQEKQSLGPHGTFFSPKRAKEVTDCIPFDEVVKAMNEADFHLSESEDAKTVAGGEIQRVMGLADSYREFYEKPLRSLLKSGVIKPGYSANELGPSFATQWAIMEPSLRPGKIIGIENKPHITAGARVAIAGFQEAGFLDGVEITVISEDKSVEIPKADLAILSLASQYEIGEMGTVDWMEQNGEIGVNGDYLHVPVPISEEELKNRIIPIKTRRRPDIPTCMSWQLGEKILSTTLMGDVYEAKLLVHETDLIKHVRLPEDKQTTRVAVFERNGKLYIEGWGFMPREDTPDDSLKIMASMRATLHDLWLGMRVATNGERTWDGNASAGVPTYAAEKGLSTAVMVTTAPKLNERMGLVMLLKNKKELTFIYENNKDLLSQIGSGKKYEDLEKFENAVNLALGQETYNDVDLVTPPHITTITMADKETFSKII